MAKSKKRRASARPAQPLDVTARYEIEESLGYFKISRALLYTRIKAGLLKVTKDGGRTFIHGSEIDRYLRLPSVAA